MKPLISVIIPIYNAEPFLVKTINSVINQSYTNTELLLIDDGSNDKSYEICNKFAQFFKNIKPFRIKNSGATKAREYGVFQATGELITFVDADDTLPPHALEVLAQNMSDNTDIVEGRCSAVAAKNVRLTALEDYRINLISGKDCIIAPWGKLFKKHLFSKHIFDIPKEIIVGEDLLMNLRLTFATTKPICQVSDIVYNYNIIETSTFRSFFPSLQYFRIMHEEMKRSIPCNHNFYNAAILKRTVVLLLSNTYPLQSLTDDNLAFGKMLQDEASAYDVKLPLHIWGLLIYEQKHIRLIFKIIYKLFHLFIPLDSYLFTADKSKLSQRALLSNIKG